MVRKVSLINVITLLLTLEGIVPPHDNSQLHSFKLMFQMEAVFPLKSFFFYALTVVNRECEIVFSNHERVRKMNETRGIWHRNQ